MKIARLLICMAVVSAGLCYTPAAVLAQSAVAPAGDPNAPWNKGITEEQREAARAVFLEGNRLFLIPLFAQAAEKYTEAIKIWKHPAFYFNLSLAQLNLGQDVEAHENLEHAIRPGVGPLSEDELKEAKRQLQEVERRLGRIQVTCQTKGAEVTLDGVALFTAPGSYQGWVKASTHEIGAKKSGYLSEAKRVTVAAGTTQSIALKLITLGEATDTSRRWAVWKPWAVVAIGGAIAAAGGGLHALASRDFNGYDDAFLQLPCVTMPDPMAPGCAKDEVPANLQSRLSHARLKQKIAVGGYIAGGSLIAAGIVLLYMNRPQLMEQGSAGSPAGRISVTPTVSGDMVGVLVNVSR